MGVQWHNISDALQACWVTCDHDGCCTGSPLFPRLSFLGQWLAEQRWDTRMADSVSSVAYFCPQHYKRNTKGLTDEQATQTEARPTEAAGGVGSSE